MVEKGSDSQGFYSTDVWKDVAEKYNIKEKLWNLVKSPHFDSIGEGLILYGEIYGPGIQKGYDYGQTEHKIVFFDVKVNGEYQDHMSVYDTIENELCLELVETLEIEKWSKELQDLHSKPVLIEGSKMYHEGIVIKHVSGDRRKIAKVVSQEYLIQQDKTDGTDFH